MSDITRLNKQCPECNNDNWVVSNEPKWYIEICNTCGYMKEIKKQDFIDNFQCPNCNCLEGTLEENKNLIAVRCKHCDKQVIVLEKHTTIEHTQEEIDKVTKTTVPNTPKCPTCGSTNISKISATKKLGGAIGFGLFSKTAKSQFECKDCGYKW